MATRQVLAELAVTYERLSGQPVVIESVGGVDATRRVLDGEAFDIVVLAADALDRLAAAGRVDPTSRVAFARSGIGVAITAGQPRPDVQTEAALRDSILSARSVGYSTGPSGRYLTQLFQRWGIADIIAARTVQAPPGVPVGDLVARGDVALGFQQLSELIHLPGIDVVGVLPPEIQLDTVFSAAITCSSGEPDAAKALLRFMVASESEAMKLRHGVMPA
ncbi:ABC transporter substrate-binding protein [Paraburkholderia aspalathi]|nr:ABC transporter substrate-binding protein [Paraburkholderia aspalathi]